MTDDQKDALFNLTCLVVVLVGLLLGMEYIDQHFPERSDRLMASVFFGIFVILGLDLARRVRGEADDD